MMTIWKSGHLVIWSKSIFDFDLFYKYNINIINNIYIKFDVNYEIHFRF